MRPYGAIQQIAGHVLATVKACQETRIYRIGKREGQRASWGAGLRVVMASCSHRRVCPRSAVIALPTSRLSRPEQKPIPGCRMTGRCRRAGHGRDYGRVVAATAPVQRPEGCPGATQGNVMDRRCLQPLMSRQGCHDFRACRSHASRLQSPTISGAGNREGAGAVLLPACRCQDDLYIMTCRCNLTHKTAEQAHEQSQNLAAGH